MYSVADLRGGGRMRTTPLSCADEKKYFRNLLKLSKLDLNTLSYRHDK